MLRKVIQVGALFTLFDAFLLTLLAAASTTIGAALGVAALAGVMVFISLEEMLPAAYEFGEDHLTIYGIIAAMAVMAVSLLLLL